MDLDDLGEPVGSGRLEQAPAEMAMQFEESGQRQPDGGRAYPGLVTLDHSGLFEATDPSGDGRRREIHALGELVERQPRIALQFADDGPVRRVQLRTHRGDGTREHQVANETRYVTTRYVRDGDGPGVVASVRDMDFELQLVMIPVSDVDRAKDFYTRVAGFDLVVDGGANEGGRIVQVTPPGSACSVGFGSGLALSTEPLVTAAPGSARGIHLVVADIVAARDELVGRGVDVGEILHVDDGQWKPGLHPDRGSYMSFAEFRDPDGNLWLLQEVRRDGDGGDR